MSWVATDRSNVPSVSPRTESGDYHVLPLVERAVEGSREAFDEIVFLYRDQVYAAAWQFTRNGEDAMDVTQEAFLRAYRALSSFKGKARFSTWLHRIVLNTCVDYLRREKKHKKNVSSSQLEEEQEGHATCLEGSIDATQRDRVYQKQIQQHIRIALANVSGRQREVFMLRYYQDLELKEIAEVLRCSEGAVKRHLHRCHQRLKELLRDIKPK